MRCLSIAVVFLVIVSSAPRLACDSCTIVSLKRDYKRASTVVRAELITQDSAHARLKVLEQCKGSPEVELSVALTGGRLCPFRGFASGAQYIVFAYRAATELVVSDCSHTNLIASQLVARELETIRARHMWWNSRFSFHFSGVTNR